MLRSAQATSNIVLLDSTITVTWGNGRCIKILGEVRNTGDSDVCFVEITYTLKDASDTVIGRDSTFALGSSKRLSLTGMVTDTVLCPGEVGAFLLQTAVPFDQVHSMHHKIGFDTFATQSLKANIELKGNLNEHADHGDWRLWGELKNRGSITGYFIKFVATIKNREGRVIDVPFKYVDGETIVLDSGETTDTALSPGAVGSFALLTLVGKSITYRINWDEEAPQSDGGSDDDHDDSGGGDGGCFISTVTR